MTYAEKLRDPRWQKKRLEILNRDKFACFHCGDKTSELQVHHSAYLKGKHPWESQNKTLFTLCSDCHEKAEIFRDSISTIYCAGTVATRNTLAAFANQHSLGELK